MPHRHYVRLPLQKTYNTRDLGGYACADGTATRWRTFLRSDDPAYCQQNDINFLLAYGLRTVIDLRSKLECDLVPSPLAGVDKIHYVNIPLGFDDFDQADDLEELNQVIASLADFYIMVLKKKTYQVRQIFELMVDRLPDTTLFHCVVGKDRTGIIAMLLLSLAEVSASDIFTNYEVTYSYVKHNPRLLDPSSGIPPELLQSRPEFLRPAYEFILQHASGAAGYLQSIGMAPERITLLKNHFSG